jgi:hypothetical protein
MQNQRVFGVWRKEKSVKPEQAIELGCEECRWYRPMVIACGYIFRDQIIQRADGVLTCNKKKPVKEAE